MKNVRLKIVTDEPLWLTGVLFYCIIVLSVTRIVHIKAKYSQVKLELNFSGILLL